MCVIKLQKITAEEIEAVFKSGGGADQVITQAILKVCCVNGRSGRKFLCVHVGFHGYMC